MIPLTLVELAKTVNGKVIPTRAGKVRVEQISLDTRTMLPEELFWAVRGEHHDGHDYLKDAERYGACAAVVDRLPADEIELPLLHVKDTTVALGVLANKIRQQVDPYVVGVTGSVGKTTTREMIHAVLSAGFDGVCSPKNFNNQWGVPLSLLQLEPEHEYAVLEMAATRAGEIGALARIARPETGVITRIAPAHLESFRSIEQIIQTKGELFVELPEDGLAVINGDDPRAEELIRMARCRVIRVGEGGQNALRATDIRALPQQLIFKLQGTEFLVPATGRHHLTSALCAVAVGQEIGLTIPQIKKGLTRFQPVAGRCAVQKIGSWTVIDDTYNASPASMQAACELLQLWPRQRKLLIIGDMLELGTESASLHRQVGQAIARSGIDCLLTLGEESRETVLGAMAAGYAKYRIAECRNWDTLLTVLSCWLQAGDVILAKGSRGMKMEQLLDRLKEWHQKEQQQIFQGYKPDPHRASA